MTVGELLKILEKQPKGNKIMLSIDPEGNGHRPVHTAEACLWSDSYGDVYNPDDYPGARAQPEDTIPVIMIWPV